MIELNKPYSYTFTQHTEPKRYHELPCAPCYNLSCEHFEPYTGFCTWWLRNADVEYIVNHPDDVCQRLHRYVLSKI